MIGGIQATRTEDGLLLYICCKYYFIEKKNVNGTMFQTVIMVWMWMYEKNGVNWGIYVLVITFYIRGTLFTPRYFFIIITLKTNWFLYKASNLLYWYLYMSNLNRYCLVLDNIYFFYICFSFQLVFVIPERNVRGTSSIPAVYGIFTKMPEAYRPRYLLPALNNL